MAIYPQVLFNLIYIINEIPYFTTLQIDYREPVEFLSTTVSQEAIVLQQPLEHSMGQVFSHFIAETHRVSVINCIALTTAVRPLDGTRIFCFSHFITLQIDSREPVDFLSTTVSQEPIVLQQPSKHSTEQEFSHVIVEIRRVSVNHCLALATAVRPKNR